MVMDERLPVLRPAPAPVEAYLSRFDWLLVSRSQRQALRDYVVALLAPRDRNKTLTALADTEPGRAGSMHREAQRLQWFLSESPWDHEVLTDQRIAMMVADPRTRPHPRGVLVLDDSGDRKNGHATAYVARRYLGSRGKIEEGIVAVTTAWADERVYYPLHTLPYQPASTLPGGKADPQFATKGQLATRLVARAVAAGVGFRALVADCFYGPGESPGFIDDLEVADIPYVVALKPNLPIPVDTGRTATPARTAAAVRFTDRSRPGRWHPIRRRYRDGSTQTWWATELTVGRYGPTRARRLVVAASDPTTLPATSTWYLATNLPRRRRRHAHRPADLTEIVRLYGLRSWIEQDYKQVKHELGWADFQVRSGRAIQRHWALVNIAFCFGWLQPDTTPPADTAQPTDTAPPGPKSWPERLRRIRAYLTPLRDLQRLARAGALSLLTIQTAALVANLSQGNGISRTSHPDHNIAKDLNRAPLLTRPPSVNTSAGNRSFRPLVGRSGRGPVGRGGGSGSDAGKR
jgi:SRSO17 transposase